VKFIIWRTISPKIEPYQVYTIHDGEEYLYMEKVHESDPSSHIVVSKDGEQVDLLTGEFIDEHVDQRQARLTMARLNGMVRVMES
jgi:hypothetical protein